VVDGLGDEDGLDRSGSPRHRDKFPIPRGDLPGLLVFKGLKVIPSKATDRERKTKVLERKSNSGDTMP
jgi:hypothetical protein